MRHVCCIPVSLQANATQRRVCTPVSEGVSRRPEFYSRPVRSSRLPDGLFTCCEAVSSAREVFSRLQHKSSPALGAHQVREPCCGVVSSRRGRWPQPMGVARTESCLVARFLVGVRRSRRRHSLQFFRSPPPGFIDSSFERCVGAGTPIPEFFAETLPPWRLPGWVG